MKCQCSEPGYCETHKRTMSDKQFGQCHADDAFFDGFARLKGRCTGLGDAVAKVTKATGIQAASKAMAKLRGRPCGCGKRQDKLNEMFPAIALPADSSSAHPSHPAGHTTDRP